MKGEVLTYTIQKGTLGGKTQFAPPVGMVFIEVPGLLEVVQHLMRTLNWSGVAHVDCRYDRKTDQYKVLEINPRYWTSLDGSLLAGVNFPWLHVKLNRQDEIAPQPFRKVEFLRLKGLVYSIKRYPAKTLSVRFIRNNTSVKYAFKDPLPELSPESDR